MPAIEVRGLSAAAKNLQLIGKVASTELSREALREAAQVINRAVKAATYKDFQKRTGAIRLGFGVRVAKEPTDGVLLSFVVQYPTALALRPTGKKLKGPPPKTGIAYWWRYLEFGTKDRRTARTPKASQAKRPRATKRGLAQRARYAAAKSLGDITPRNWVRPAFAANAPGAIAIFGGSFRKRVEIAVRNLPKT